MICRCCRSSSVGRGFGARQGQWFARQAAPPAHQPYRHIATLPRSSGVAVAGRVFPVLWKAWYRNAGAAHCRRSAQEIKGYLWYAGATRPLLLDSDRNLVRVQRRVERIRRGVAQHQLERVVAGRQLDASLGLACSEMKMVLVLGDGFVGIERFVDIDQQMIMSAVLKIVPRMRYAHVAQTETTPKSAFNRGAVLRPNEIKHRIFWRGFSLSVGSERNYRQRRR